MSVEIMITLIIVLRSIIDHSTAASSAITTPHVIDLRNEVEKEGGPWRYLRGPPKWVQDFETSGADLRQQARK